MGHHGDDLLRQHVQRVSQEAGRLHVAFVHGARDGRAGYEVGTILGEDNPVEGGAHLVAGTSDALHAAGYDGRSFNLNHQVDRAHVDAEFQRTVATSALICPAFNSSSISDRCAAASEPWCARAIGSPASSLIAPSQSFRYSPRVDEDERRGALADDLQQPRIDGLPDRGSLRSLDAGPLGSSSIWPRRAISSTGTSTLQFQCLACAGIDDGDGPYGTEHCCSLIGLVFASRRSGVLRLRSSLR